MSDTPEVEEPISCVKVSSEEAQRKMRETTETELAKLAEIMKTQKIPSRNEVISDTETSDSDNDDCSDYEDYIPSKRKRISKQSIVPQDVESKMYIDNQKLWQKIHKYGIELNRTEKELHYMQLELNNKTVECNEMKNLNKELISVNYTNTKLKKQLWNMQIYFYFYVFLLFMCIVDYICDHTFFPKTLFYTLKTFSIIYNVSGFSNFYLKLD